MGNAPRAAGTLGAPGPAAPPAVARAEPAAARGGGGGGDDDASGFAVATVRGDRDGER